MKNVNFLLVVCICIISGCIRVPVKEELSQLKNNIKETTNQSATWPRYEKKELPSEQEAEKGIIKGCSRQDAIKMALERNPDLQAKFEELGISKADFVEAGLFTNPYVSTSFSWTRPRDPEDGASKYFSGSFLLSDFWNVPAKKVVSRDELSIKIFEITQSVINLIAETKNSYDSCIYNLENVKLTEDIVLKMKKLRDHLKEISLTSKQISKFEEYYADVTVGQWELEAIKQKVAYENSLVALRSILNLSVNENKLLFTDLVEYKCQMPSIDQLEKIAIEYTPIVQSSKIAIKKAQHLITLEKAKIFNNVSIGGFFSRSGPESRSRGFTIETDIPIFDTKNPAIMRAKFALHRATQNYLSELLKTKRNVRQLYNQIQGLKRELEIYDSVIIPNVKLATEHKENGENSTKSWSALITAYIDLYQSTRNKLTATYNILKTHNDLERAIGKTIF